MVSSMALHEYYACASLLALVTLISIGIIIGTNTPLIDYQDSENFNEMVSAVSPIELEV